MKGIAGMGNVYSQDHARVRMEWGPVGAAAVSPGAHVAVVVDVLSFTTTLSVAADRGVEVLPYRWRDESALAYARTHDATLAVGRFEARASDGREQVSLSPHSIRSVEGLRRLVLPSPNGSAISFQLAKSGAQVVGACLRNRSAVARWLVAYAKSQPDVVIAVIAAGERWHDGTLRPAVEDLWGAGSVLAALEDLGLRGLSPEARSAAAAFRSVAVDVGGALFDCSGGRELVEATFGDDVAVAAELDASDCVPVLDGTRFVNQAGRLDQPDPR